MIWMPISVTGTCKTAKSDFFMQSAVYASVDRARTASTAGFTLIEILVVVMIISIATGMALLSVDVTGHQKARTFIKEVRFLMHNLSNEAILSGNPHGLRWNRKAGTVTPLIYQSNHWKQAANMQKITWRGFATASLVIDGMVLDEIKDKAGDNKKKVLRGFNEEKKRPDLPAVLFWSTGLWEPAGEIKIEIEGISYADIIWTASGRTSVQYPDEEI